MRSLMLLLFALLLGAAACGNDSKRPPDSSTVIDRAAGDRSAADRSSLEKSITEARPPDLPPGPVRPTIGDTIDRAGRAGVNILLTDPFNFDGQHDSVQDAYNQNADPSTWATAFQTRIAGNLAIYDILDGTCGNQLLYDAVKGGASFAAAGYATFAGMLADDQLYVQTNTGTCKQYLAAEIGVVTGTPSQDCGGRAPSYDVVDWTYGILSGANKAVSDGVSSDPDGSPSDTTFPFMGAPN